jgi:hypothetical protein
MVWNMIEVRQIQSENNEGQWLFETTVDTGYWNKG